MAVEPELMKVTRESNSGGRAEAGAGTLENSHWQGKEKPAKETKQPSERWLENQERESSKLREESIPWMGKIVSDAVGGQAEGKGRGGRPFRYLNLPDPALYTPGPRRMLDAKEGM